MGGPGGGLPGPFRPVRLCRPGNRPAAGNGGASAQYRPAGRAGSRRRRDRGKGGPPVFRPLDGVRAEGIKLTGSRRPAACLSQVEPPRSRWTRTRTGSARVTGRSSGCRPGRVGGMRQADSAGWQPVSWRRSTPAEAQCARLRSNTGLYDAEALCRGAETAGHRAGAPVRQDDQAYAPDDWANGDARCGGALRAPAHRGRPTCLHREAPGGKRPVV